MVSQTNFSMKFFITFFMITLALVKLNDASNKRLCGKELTIALELICDNVYNEFSKKSIDVEDYYNDQYVEDDLPYPYGRLPFLAKVRGAGAIIPKVRRQRHGVSDECCKKPCTFKELSSYCKYPQDRERRSTLF